jgi:uncharacterized membrane protein YpjA
MNKKAAFQATVTLLICFSIIAFLSHSHYCLLCALCIFVCLCAGIWFMMFLKWN